MDDKLDFREHVRNIFKKINRVHLFIYTLFYVDIYNKKHKNIVIYTTHNSQYTNSDTNGIQ